MHGSTALSIEDYSFSVSGFSGFEDEILRVRNANRSVAQTRQYLEWRYSRPAEVPEPIVFWVRSGTGEAVGMASLIFRPYWVDNTAVSLGVLGDISLDERLRGKGLGRRLLEYVRQYLEQHLPGCAAFVIPTEAARKSLISSGWKSQGRLLTYVLPFNPVEKLRGVLKSGFLAKHVAGLATKSLSTVAKLHIKKGYEIQLVNEMDASFQALWDNTPKDHWIIGDRGLESLKWRYADHPHNSFHAVKLLKKGELIGYLVYAFSQTDMVCYVYDLIVKHEKDLLCMIGLFLMNSFEQGTLGTVRVGLNEGHPYARRLWRLGFIPRYDQGTFFGLWPDGFAPRGASRWFICLGDKDV